MPRHMQPPMLTHGHTPTVRATHLSSPAAKPLDLAACCFPDRHTCTPALPCRLPPSFPNFLSHCPTLSLPHPGSWTVSPRGLVAESVSAASSGDSYVPQALPVCREGPPCWTESGPHKPQEGNLGSQEPSCPAHSSGSKDKVSPPQHPSSTSPPVPVLLSPPSFRPSHPASFSDLEVGPGPLGRAGRARATRASE